MENLLEKYFMVDDEILMDNESKLLKLFLYSGKYVDISGTTIWFKNGVPHREDGPAVIFSNDIKFWYQNGLLHRDDGPAFIDNNKCESWYKNGKRHRIDGPAVEIRSRDYKEYWVNGFRRFIDENHF